jgi:hypothetical protein
MKSLLLSIILFTSVTSFAGGYRFPNQQYAYAQMHLFNTHYESGRPDLHIYKNGVYAQSKIGNGIWLNEKFLTKLSSIFSRGIDEIWMGLSKCTVPRHGIIYYNYDNEPIASVSMCFECQQVNFWSSKDMNHTTDYDKMDLKKAEQQINDLKKLVQTTSIKVFEESKDYKAYVDNDDKLKNEGTMEIKDYDLDSLLGHKIMMTEVKGWIKGPLRFERDTLEKMTFRESYYFYKYASTVKNDNTNFLVSGTEEDSHLIQAEIYSPFVILPNGISVGMSTNDVVGLYPVPTTEVPNYPEKLTVSGENSKIEYTFKNQTLVKIILYVWVD